MFLRFKPHLNQVAVQRQAYIPAARWRTRRRGGDSGGAAATAAARRRQRRRGGDSGGGLPGSNQGKICSTDIDCVDKDWPGAIVSYIYFTDDAQPSQGVDENNPL